MGPRAGSTSFPRGVPSHPFSSGLIPTLLVFPSTRLSRDSSPDDKAGSYHSQLGGMQMHLFHKAGHAGQTYMSAYPASQQPEGALAQPAELPSPLTWSPVASSVYRGPVLSSQPLASRFLTQSWL